MAQQANHALPAGFQLDDYCIDRQLSLGGFSIVYLATDAAGMEVAIKEYLPNSLALRSEGGIKPIITADHVPAFRYGMKCFSRKAGHWPNSRTRTSSACLISFVPTIRFIW